MGNKILTVIIPIYNSEKFLPIVFKCIEKRNERYKSCCKVLLEGLKKLNLDVLVKEENSSMLLTTIVEPEIKGYSFEKMHQYLYEKGFTIYPGKISFKNTFRIANIGNININDMKSFVFELENYFKTL